MKNHKNKRVGGGRSPWEKSWRVQLGMQYKPAEAVKGRQRKENINFRTGNDHYNITSYYFIKQ